MDKDVGSEDERRKTGLNCRVGISNSKDLNLKPRLAAMARPERRERIELEQPTP